MSDELKLLAMILVKNTIMLICFTILSIVFKHWWIVFFSAFFLSGGSGKDKK